VLGASRALPKLRGAILDFDDTIVNSRSRILPVMVEVLADLGFSIRPSEIATRWGEPLELVVKGAAPAVDFAEFKRRYLRRLAEVPPTELPGARRFLEELAAHAVTTLVVSSGSKDAIESDLRDLELTALVRRVWGYEDSGYAKPDARILAEPLALLADLGVGLGEILSVGDSLDDFRISRAHNILFVAVVTGTTSSAEFTAAGMVAELVVRGLDELFTGGLLQRYFAM